MSTAAAPRLNVRLLAQFAISVLLAANACAAAETNDVAARMQAPPLFPALVEAAKADGIPVERIQPSGETNGLRPGDSATVLLVQHQKGVQPNERVICVQVATPGSKELPEGPAAPLVVYTSLGDKLEFQSSPIMVTVRNLGPFFDSASREKERPAPDKNARLSLDEGSLALGLDGLAAFHEHRDQLHNEGKPDGYIEFGDSPYKAEEIDKCRKANATNEITLGDERALVGGLLAMVSYLETVAQTPGLKKLLFHVVDLPSAWSLLWNRGVDWSIDHEHDVTEADGASWGLEPGTRIYYLPETVRANGHRALELTMVVTAPRPPLLVCGGIIGFLAQNPLDTNNFLTVRVIDARQGKRFGK
jgi:hypothetical protein